MIKGIEKLQLNAAQRRLVEVSEMNYKRYGRIYFQVISFENNVLTLKVWQGENEAGKYLTVQELVERANGVFKDVIPEGATIHVRPIPFKQDNLAEFSISDIENSMNELSLKPKDLVKLLNIDKSTISVMLSEGRSMTKSHKAMFYYLFKFLKSHKTH
jgi:hypothetical protein